MRILIDIKTKINETLVEKLIAPVEGKYDEGRYLYQICNANRDTMLTDVAGFAMYHPSFTNMEKYKETDGIAIDDNENQEQIIRNIYKVLSNFKANYVGWELKTFIVPILYRQFINYGLPIDLLDSCFDLYPYDQKKTIDLSAVFNFNRQMVTTRSRSQYYLPEVYFVYGGEALMKNGKEWLGETTKEKLIRRIEMSKFLFDRWGFEW